ncbi:MAG: hypothetical protein R2856_09010 [Caldilineaceae bacterium]
MTAEERLRVGALDQHVDREDDVFGVEGFAVAPGDALTQVDRQLGEVFTILVAGGQPGDLLFSLGGEGREEVEGFPQRGAADLVRGASGVGVAQAGVFELAGLAAEHVDNGVCGRHQRRLRHGV